MIEKLKDSHGVAFGFKVTGSLTADDIVAISKEIDFVIAEQKKPIGLLVDLSDMHGASWAARWEQMRFLQRHTDHIARMAVVSNDKWEEVLEMVVVATAALQAETLYFDVTEVEHAWHWVKMSKLDEGRRVRIMYPGKGLFHDYTPEYMDV